MVGGKVTVLLLVDIKVATFSVAVIKAELVLEVVVDIIAPDLEGVDVTVRSTSVAFVKVATALEVVDVGVAVLEVVSVIVASTSIAIVSGTRYSKWSTLK